MKSEKAKEFIDKEILRMDNESLKCCYGYNEERDGISYLEIDEVRTAIELAEQEAEERMRRKAIRAFCENECGGTCEIADKCETLKCFIQKLNAAEIDGLNDKKQR